VAVAISAVRFTDWILLRSHPSSELLGYYQSSARRTGPVRGSGYYLLVIV